MKLSVKTPAPASLSASTARTVLQLAASSSKPVKVIRYWVSGDSTSNTDGTLFVRILRQTSAGTGTSNTPTKLDSAETTSTSATATHSHTSTEPTSGDVLLAFHASPRGMTAETFRAGYEINLPVSTRLGIEITSATGCNVLAGFVYEE